MSRRFHFSHGRCRFAARAKVLHHVSNHAEGFVFILGKVVRNTGLGRVDVGSAKLFSRDLFSRSGFHQRRPCEEDRAVALDDDGLVGHGGYIGATSGARPQNGGHLGDSVAGHAGLIAENPTKVPDVGKDLVLHGQEGPTGINQVNAGQVVFMGDAEDGYLYVQGAEAEGWVQEFMLDG